MVHSSQWLRPPSLCQSLSKRRALRRSRKYICHLDARSSGHYKRGGDEISFLPHRHATKWMLINGLIAQVHCQQPIWTWTRAANLNKHFTHPCSSSEEDCHTLPMIAKLDPAAWDKWGDTTVLLRRTESASIGTMQLAAIGRNRTTKIFG